MEIEPGMLADITYKNLWRQGYIFRQNFKEDDISFAVIIN